MVLRTKYLWGISVGIIIITNIVKNMKLLLYVIIRAVLNAVKITVAIIILKSLAILRINLEIMYSN